MTDIKRAGRRDDAFGQLWEALSDCPSLSERSAARDALWLTVWSVVCTRGHRSVKPMGSRGEIVVGGETVTDELIAAMEWLNRCEVQARGLSPTHLFLTLRGVATRSARGSGRAAQANSLHGLTDVPPGHSVRWISLDAEGAA